jgi:hypothetical protein
MADEIIGLQKMLELVSIHLQAQADATLHILSLVYYCSA